MNRSFTAFVKVRLKGEANVTMCPLTAAPDEKRISSSLPRLAPKVFFH